MSKAALAKGLRWSVTLLLVGFLLHWSQPEQVWQALRQASAPGVAAYGGLGVIATVLGAAALLVLFDVDGRPAWRLRFVADYLYVQGLAQFTPAQLGELALPYLASRKRYAAAEIAAALVIQRISALLIVVALALLGAGRWAPPAYLWTASLAVCAACAAAVLVMLRPGGLGGSLDRFRVGQRVERLLGASRSMLMQRADRLAWHAGLMLLRYVVSVLSNAALLAAFDIHVPVLDLAAITALAILTTLVPITVGGIGLTEGIFAIALKSYGYAAGMTITAVLAGRVVNAVLALVWVVLHRCLPRDTGERPGVAGST
jgi:glycosyltransferase 2 family protein